MNIVTIQDKVKMMRLRKDATHSDAAGVLGIPSTSYSRRETNKIDFTPEEIFSLCDNWGFNRHFVVGDFPLDSADRNVFGKDLDDVMKYLERVPPNRLKEVAEFLSAMLREE